MSKSIRVSVVVLLGTVLAAGCDPEDTPAPSTPPTPTTPPPTPTARARSAAVPVIAGAGMISHWRETYSPKHVRVGPART